MSQIDHLIAEYCPDGVEVFLIEDIFNLRNGYTPSKSNQQFWNGGSIPWFRMEDIRDNGGILNDSIQHVSEAAVKGGKLFPANSLIVATSATIGEHALITVPHLSNQRFTSLSLKPEFSNKLDMKFAYYYGFVLDEWCRNNTTFSSFASVDMRGFRKFSFPVPPLEVQRAIVEILDKFTALEAELEAELEARKKQYDFYLKDLLSFGEDEAKWMTLENIGKVSMCKRIFKSQTSTQGDIPFFKIGTFGGEPDAFISREIYEQYKEQYNFPKRGDILISAAGTIGRAVKYDGEPAYFQDSNIVWIDNDESIVTNNYLFYWYRIITWATDGGTIRRLYNNNIRKAKIAVPSLGRQAEIVDFLDKFNVLVNDLSSGLPAEIEARRKQYKYYRDQLLTFKELSA